MYINHLTIHSWLSNIRNIWIAQHVRTKIVYVIFSLTYLRIYCTENIRVCSSLRFAITARNVTIQYTTYISRVFKSKIHHILGNCFQIISFFFFSLVFFLFPPLFFTPLLFLRYGFASVRARSPYRRTCSLPIVALINSRPLLWRSHYWKN